MQSAIVLYRDTIAMCSEKDNCRLPTAHNVLRGHHVFNNRCLNKIKKDMRKAPQPLKVPAHIHLICHTSSKANGNRSHGRTHGTGTVLVKRRCWQVGTFPKGTVVFSCVVFGKDEETWRAGYPATLTNNIAPRRLSSLLSFFLLQHAEITILIKRIAGHDI